jgi:hypothetical protein
VWRDWEDHVFGFRVSRDWLKNRRH